ncbi:MULTISPECIES: hypothetical protein [unclassified Microcoleus]|uniref:hypothetical protein n=1 Tax=unclassified Microcoleus TaxID=2642155 RepID=UPI002FD2B53B
MRSSRTVELMLCRLTAPSIEHLQIGHLAELRHYTTDTVCFRIGIGWLTDSGDRGQSWASQ